MNRKYTQIERQCIEYMKLLGNTYGIAADHFTRTFEVTRMTVDRDLQDLEKAGLMRVKQAVIEDRKVYCDAGETVHFDESVTGTRRSHLVKLNRLCKILREWEYYVYDSSDAEGKYAGVYSEMFPGLSRRTMRRDFAILNDAGFSVIYDRKNRVYEVVTGYF